MAKDKKKEEEPVNESTESVNNNTETPDTEHKEQTTEQTAEQTTEQTPEQKPAEAPVLNEYADLKDKFMRLAADFDNFKKRSRAEKDGMYQLATADTVQKFLPLIDEMELALAAAKEESPLRKGIEQVVVKSAAILASLGVEPICGTGDQFDVSLHEAVMQEDSDDYADNEVIEVYQKGYKLGTKVIRYAKVKVNR